MKLIQRYIAVAILGTLGMASCAQAADATNDDNNLTVSYPLYHPQELTLDFFASGTVNQQTINHVTGERIRHDGLAGGGAGATFYFLRYLGVGGDFTADGREHAFFDSASGNVFVRLPITQTGLAPYIFGGGGYEFKENEQSFGQAGAGLEFRFTHNVGIFADARYVFAERTDDYGLARVGLRIAF